MRLSATRQQSLTYFEPNDLVVTWSIDVEADAADDSPEAFSVGRVLTDELRRFEIDERGETMWDVADADSSGLEAAWAALLDEKGAFRAKDFLGEADPVVYLYRFELHPDFVEWRLAVMDAICRLFGSSAIILAQYHTTLMAETEFSLLGFRNLPAPRFPAPVGFTSMDRETRFMVRDNAGSAEFTLANYPTSAPAAFPSHETWLESRHQWSGLV